MISPFKLWYRGAFEVARWEMELGDLHISVRVWRRNTHVSRPPPFFSLCRQIYVLNQILPFIIQETFEKEELKENILFWGTKIYTYIKEKYAA